MFEFTNAKNITLVNIIRAMQEETGEQISAASTLLRLKRVDLLAKIETMAEANDLAIADDGSVTSIDPGNQEITVSLTGLPIEIQNDIDAVNYLLANPGVLEDETPEEIEAEYQDALNTDGIDIDEDDEAPADGAAPKGKGRLFADDAIITVLVPNPRRAGSIISTRFDLMQTGMTVAGYIAAVEKATGSTQGARRTVRKSVKKGHITVSSAAKE